MDLFFYFSVLASVYFIFDHVQMIGPWRREQMLFFLSFMLTVNHLHMTMVSENFWELSFLIRTGGMDFILLKPVHSLFISFFRHFRPATLLNGIAAWSFLIYFGIKINLPTLSWVLLPPMVLAAFALTVLTEMILSVSMFWLVEGFGINFLRMQFQQLSRWPDFIYGKYTRRVLTLMLPLLLVGSAPVRFLFNFSDYHLLLIMLIAIVILFKILLWAWDLGLKKYDSASS
jgi:ABC-2 type transport system permease protein